MTSNANPPNASQAREARVCSRASYTASISLADPNREDAQERSLTRGTAPY